MPCGAKVAERRREADQLRLHSGRSFASVALAPGRLCTTVHVKDAGGVVGYAITCSNPTCPTQSSNRHPLLPCMPVPSLLTFNKKGMKPGLARGSLHQCCSSI
jgi:hypothetical protein